MSSTNDPKFVIKGVLVGDDRKDSVLGHLTIPQLLGLVTNPLKMSSKNDPKNRSQDYLVNNGEDTVTATLPVRAKSAPLPRKEDHSAAEQWLNAKFPKCTQLDVDCTMERYEFPDHVRRMIFATWDKISPSGGGTYKKRVQTEKEQLKEHYKTHGMIAGCPMDDANATAAAVMATDGGEAAVKSMFTRPDGSTRSYSEMRSMYG